MSPRSRSRSPTSRRRDPVREPDRRRPRDRERDRGGRSQRDPDRSREWDAERERLRERERERERWRRENDRPERSRSRERRATSSQDRDVTPEINSSRPMMQTRPQLTDADFQGKTAEEIEMMQMMGFGGFDTTKGKRVDGNNQGAVHVVLKRRYRQYMNRKGGFNRPLDFVL